jgi:2',3'-cyclic-nucleotide 2'-phosphodiesterase/3'-nucleotidase
LQSSFDLKENKETTSSLARECKRTAEDTNWLFFLDNGDILQKFPVVYYYNFEKTDTIHLYADVMNYMQYDAATIGNHDIETGHDVYDKFNKEIKFPWLAANAINTETNQPYLSLHNLRKRWS